MLPLSLLRNLQKVQLVLSNEIFCILLVQSMQIYSNIYAILLVCCHFSKQKEQKIWILGENLSNFWFWKRTPIVLRKSREQNIVQLSAHLFKYLKCNILTKYCCCLFSIQNGWEIGIFDAKAREFLVLKKNLNSTSEIQRTRHYAIVFSSFQVSKAQYLN